MSNQYNGWVDDQGSVESVMQELPFPIFGDVWSPIKDSGKGKVVLLYDIIRKVSGGFPIRSQLIGDCQPKDTLIFGPDFVKKIQDVKIGDRVYAGNGDITTVISTLCKQSNNPILTIHTKGGLPLRVTSDHKVLAYRFGEFVNSNNKWRRRYSPGYQRTCINNRGEDTKLKGNTVFSTRAAELVKASDLTEADYVLCPINIEIDNKIPDDMLPYMGDKEVRWMIGLFLGDGHAKKTSKILEWGCTTDEPDIEERLCKALDILNIKWRSYFHCKSSNKARKVYTLKIENVFNLFKKYFYDDNGNKTIPSWAINDDVISGLLDSDGYTSRSSGKARQEFENTSFSLVHGVRIWALRNGYTPSLNERQRFDKRTNRLNKKVYKVSWLIDKSSRNLWKDDQYLAMPIVKIDVEEGPHNEVYDIGVKHKLHTFITGAGVSISNCVSMGAAYAVDAIKAVDIFIKKETEEWIAETSTEDIYGGSRVQIGKGRIGTGDGSVGAWAAQYVNKYGALARQKYGNVDLTKYNSKVAKAWGMPGKGVPQELIPFCKEHPVEVVSQVYTYAEVRDLISNGYAVTVASSQGFSSKRDSEGFARPEGSWQHQMSILGVDDSYKRPGVLIQNSWGLWNSGPKRHNQPDGSFWVDADVLEKRMLSKKDSWAFSGYGGFKARKLNTRIF